MKTSALSDLHHALRTDYPETGDGDGKHGALPNALGQLQRSLARRYVRSHVTTTAALRRTRRASTSPPYGIPPKTPV